jgi:hypothetical protein
MKRHLCATIIVLSFALLLIAPVSAGPDFNQSFTEGEIIHYNVTSTMDPGRTTPIEVWVTAALLGLGLFIASIRVSTSTPELERDAIISVMAWVPIGFTAATAFAVDRISSYGVTAGTNEYVLMEHHTIYHFDILGYLYAILLLFAIINTIRILALHKSLKLQNDSSGQQTRGNH